MYLICAIYFPPDHSHHLCLLTLTLLKGPSASYFMKTGGWTWWPLDVPSKPTILQRASYILTHLKQTKKKYQQCHFDHQSLNNPLVPTAPNQWSLVCAPSGSFRYPGENTFHIYLKVPIMLEIPDRHLFFIKVATFLAC